MPIVDLYKLSAKQKTGYYTKPQIKELFALSCGEVSTLRSVGYRPGNEVFNDASSLNLEIQRYAREVFGLELKCWWHE